MNNNSGLKFSHLDSDNQLEIEEIKPVSLADLLTGHNHGDDEHHDEDEHEHDYNYDLAVSDSTSNQNKTFISTNVINPLTAKIDVNYYGFSQEAKNAFEYAVNIWEGWIKSDVAIEVDAYWEDLSQYGSGVLGAASPYSFTRNFTGATEDNTYYPISLANHLAGEDLNGDNAEIEVYLNSEFSRWYLGTDGNTPNGQYDFATVVLHELVHGLGLTDFISYYNGKGSYGNTIFESFVVNGDNQSLNTFTNNAKELGKQLTSNDLFFNGANATEANGGLNPKLYAPSRWEFGSSVAHLDEKTYPKGDKDALMTPYFAPAEAIHNPGGITLGILEDLGWDINEVETAPVIDIPPAPTIPQSPVAETKLSPAIPALNFNSLESYGGQDKNHTLNISADGKEFEVQGNSWKKLALDYNITEDTILEFEYNSILQGEIQGIGFDTDNKLSGSDGKRLFQLSGTQKNWGISDFEYQANSGWQSYQIRVGDYFTGNFNYLTFANDHDKGTKDAHSQYRNLRLYEEGQQPVAPINTTPVPPVVDTLPQPPVAEIPVESQSTTIPALNFDSLESYGGQDKNHILNISADGKEFEVQGNSWKKLAVDYKITEDTILEFEYKSIIQGEIQGIGFDTDNKLSSKDFKNLFQLLGSDKNRGISDFEYQTNSGWQSYQIRVGDYFTGNFNYLTFANDHDKGTKDAQSQYRNLRLYEEGQQVQPVVETETTQPVVEAIPIEIVDTPSTQSSIINIEESELTSYASQDKNSTFTISDNKQEIEIQGNGWKKLSLDYAITDKTILEFEFQSDVRGEIQGIGFDTDDKFKTKDDNPRLFQLEGSQKVGVSDFKDDVTGQNWKSYQIEVGEYFTGDINYLTFVNDHDSGQKNATSKYRNIKVYEGDTNKLGRTQNQDNLNSDILLSVKDSTNNYTISSYGGVNQDKGTFSISDDNTEVEITGNAWKKLDINNYNVTENTVLKFEFQSTAEGEVQGIGFDNDDIISGGDRTHLFQVSGTQDWGVEIEDNYTLGSGWQTYEVKVGDYFTGEFDYLTLASDDDSNSIAQSQFRNISLSEM